ncbi:MAG: membrane protein insertase YidC [Alphaproteobacteria bacterium]|jgi:YidC/Oxa1 family membrane protein insertase|nr:membrane protein insertase YidC [Alphaproteobacteria bacterium]
MPEQRNLLLAIVLSVAIIFAFQYFYELPRMQQAQEEARREAVTQQDRPDRGEAARGTAAESDAATGAAAEAPPPEAPRIEIRNDRVAGSISLAGARIDELRLLDYGRTPRPGSERIELLRPVGEPLPYFAEFGFVPEGDGVAVPDSTTVWSSPDRDLAPGSPVRLTWDNGEGLQFAREIALDDNYVFTVTQTVTNTGDTPVTLYPYGLVSRWGTPDTMGIWILHEGPIGVLDGTLEEFHYGDLQDEGGTATLDSTGGWLGITDKYWLTALLPDQDSGFRATVQHVARGTQDRYQTDYLRDPITIAPGGSAEVTDRLFAGAKEVTLLDRYKTELGLPLFDRAVDFGWFWFLTKPFFYALHWLAAVFGNYGVAILLLTLVVKLIFFPLANKSYKSMSQMKKLQPEMMKIRERYSEDREKMNMEIMNLYKKEKVNPAAGCLPILIQIPVFFALYKVLFVSLEMRHAPFFGWIQDLSAPDPTTILNLFGLLPFTPPELLPALGVWPLLMGATMWLQFKLNPTPPDPMQARIMSFLPLIFIFVFATFPAGLVIYWTWNNILSVGQQWLIMRKMNVQVT